MPEDSPKSAPGEDLEESSNCGQPLAERNNLEFTDEEAPILEIGEEVALIDLPEDDQMEVALDVLDQYQAGDAVNIIPNSQAEQPQYALQDAPDPAFVIIPENAMPTVASTVVPADLRETMIPDIPITMDMEAYDLAEAKETARATRADQAFQEFQTAKSAEVEESQSTPTRSYPPEVLEKFKHTKAFYQSPFAREYDQAVREHLQAVQLHLTGVVIDSSYPMPPSFIEYLDRFILAQKEPEQSSPTSAAASISKKISGLYSAVSTRDTRQRRKSKKKR